MPNLSKNKLEKETNSHHQQIKQRRNQTEYKTTPIIPTDQSQKAVWMDAGI